MAISSVYKANGTAPILIVCEHASKHIPEEFENLGLDNEALNSHAAWDIGAFELAKKMTDKLNARLFHSTVSRLIYDCNRPPNAKDAMPERSEIFTIPANQGLSQDAKEARIRNYYLPFKEALEAQVQQNNTKLMVTIHSFTPVYNGKKREVEIGILHDSDTRLADEMLHFAKDKSNYKIERNQPYTAMDGVTHSLKEHGIKNGLLNVMIEVRNDLLQDARQQEDIAQLLHDLLECSLEGLGLKDGART